jgi:hypothetical protein
MTSHRYEIGLKRKGQTVNEITLALSCSFFIEKHSTNSCNWRKHTPAICLRTKFLFFSVSFFIPGMSNENNVAITPSCRSDDLIFDLGKCGRKVFWVGREKDSGKVSRNFTCYLRMPTGQLVGFLGRLALAVGLDNVTRIASAENNSKCEFLSTLGGEYC